LRKGRSGKKRWSAALFPFVGFGKKPGVPTMGDDHLLG